MKATTAGNKVQRHANCMAYDGYQTVVQLLTVGNWFPGWVTRQVLMWFGPSARSGQNEHSVARDARNRLIWKWSSWSAIVTLFNALMFIYIILFRVH